MRPVPIFTANDHPWGVLMPLAKCGRDPPENVACTASRTDRQIQLHLAYILFTLTQKIENGS